LFKRKAKGHEILTGRGVGIFLKISYIKFVLYRHAPSSRRRKKKKEGNQGKGRGPPKEPLELSKTFLKGGGVDYRERETEGGISAKRGTHFTGVLPTSSRRSRPNSGATGRKEGATPEGNVRSKTMTETNKRGKRGL